MADTDKPLADLAATEKKIDPPKNEFRKAPEPEPEPETSAAARLRAFEDEKLGEDCVRINDRIERGSGSPFSAMSDEDKATYAKLERLVATERKLAEAHAALIQADADHEAAQAALEAKPDADSAE